MFGGRLKVALAVAAALAAAIAIVQSVDRSDAPKSETPGQATTRAAERANRSDPDVVVARSAADARLAHAPFVAAPPEGASEPDAEARPTPPPDARRIVVEAVFEDGDPVVGCVVEAAPLGESESRGTTETYDLSGGRGRSWSGWNVRLRRAQLDARGRAELLVPPQGRFVVRSVNEGFTLVDIHPAIGADDVPFRSDDVAPDARSVRIVVPAVTLSMTVRDQHGLPVAGRTFVLRAIGGGLSMRRRSDDRGRVRWHLREAGAVVVSDDGRMLQSPSSLPWFGRSPPVMKRSVDGIPVKDSSAFCLDEVRICGEPVDAPGSAFTAEAPCDVDVRMRTMPLGVIRVIDGDDRAAKDVYVSVDAGFSGSPFRRTLASGVTDIDGTASVDVPCDGHILAVDAPLTTLRWRLWTPTGREERTVEVPVASTATLVDAGTVKLASHRTWKVRFACEGGTVGHPVDATLATIPREDATPAEENREPGAGFWNYSPEATHLYPRIEDMFLRVRRNAEPRQFCDVRIDRDAASVDSPGQLVACTSWRTPAEPYQSLEPEWSPIGTEPRVKLVVRVESAIGVPVPNLELRCSSDSGAARTDELGAAEFQIPLGPGRVWVVKGQPFHAALPWSVEFDATEPETRALMRAEALRDVVVRTSPEHPDASWDPDAVMTRVFTEGAPRIACERVERVNTSEPRRLVEDRFVAPGDEDVVVEHRYFGVSRVVRLPPTAGLAEFRVGPIYPVRWTAPPFPVLIEFELKFVPLEGGDPAYEADGTLHPGNGAFASGEMRLPPGRYRARLQVVVPEASDGPFVVDYERLVDVTPDRPTVVDFGP